jgi:hypothetical protein
MNWCPTAVLLTNTLIRDYLLNYARPLIYTTSLSNAAIVAASCSFDLLEDGTAEKVRVPAPFFPRWPFQSLPLSSRHKSLKTRHTSKYASVHPSLRHLSLRTYSPYRLAFNYVKPPRRPNRQRRSYRF